MVKLAPKVISLVPSWTETLLEAGVEVVGRSRFCVHPRDKACSIPAVGGTKDVNKEKVERLGADILLLDREENTKQMAETLSLKVVDTHVESLEDLRIEFSKLAKLFDNTQLLEWANELSEILNRPSASWSWSNFPGCLEWICPLETEPKNFVYIIWKEPWMAINSNTFIASMIEKLGGQPFHLNIGEGKYPKFNLSQLNPKETLLVFSSEPFPFAKQKKLIKNLGFPAVLVDGECWSWFGVRSLRFLRQQLSGLNY